MMTKSTRIGTTMNIILSVSIMHIVLGVSIILTLFTVSTMLIILVRNKTAKIKTEFKMIFLEKLEYHKLLSRITESDHNGEQDPGDLG